MRLRLLCLRALEEAPAKPNMPYEVAALQEGW
jgi:hypothetical protein